MEVLINTTYGGFRIPDEVIEEYLARTGKKIYTFDRDNEIRTDETIVSIFKEKNLIGVDMGATEIDVYEIPDDYDFYITDYDGFEEIHLKVRESRLRELVQEGNEDKIVEYVMGANQQRLDLN